MRKQQHGKDVFNNIHIDVHNEVADCVLVVISA